MSNQEVLTFEGHVRVLPRVADKKDDIARVALVTESGEEFPVLHKGVGMDLTQHVNAHARVTGTLCPCGENTGLIVRQFTLTDGFEDEWYDDQDE